MADSPAATEKVSLSNPNQMFYGLWLKRVVPYAFLLNDQEISFIGKLLFHRTKENREGASNAFWNGYFTFAVTLLRIAIPVYGIRHMPKLLCPITYFAETTPP